MFQATTSLSEGKAAAQSLSSSSLKPPATGSIWNVTGQVLSRAALEISQAPTMPLAASLGAGACARAPAGNAIRPSTTAATAARSDMGNPATIGTAGTLSRPLRPVMPGLFLLRRPGRFGHRGEWRLAGGPGHEVVDHQLIHPRTGRDRGRAEMGKQHDVLHRDQLRRHVWLVGEYVEAGGED